MTDPKEPPPICGSGRHNGQWVQLDALYPQPPGRPQTAVVQG